MYIIATFPSLSIDIELYPAVKEHLMGYGYDRLKQTGDKGSRKKTNNQWFETQDSISYWEDFYKQKIVYPDIMRMPSKIELLDDYPFIYLDDNKFYIEATNFMITGENIDFIYSFLVSEVGFYTFSKFYTGPQFDATGFRYKKAYLEEAFVPLIKSETINPINELKKFQSDKVLFGITNNKIWFDLIGLNDEEISHIINYKKELLEHSR